MAQVNFYTLSNKNSEARLQFACRLIEKAYSLGHKVYVHAESAEQARTLDELLWQFSPSSFVPHGLAATESSDTEAVIIGDSLPDASHKDVLINLGQEACEAHGQFTRINEIITGDEDSLQQGRRRYRFCQDQGYQTDTFKL
jgi:DNA polymerase III subunit chi